MHRLWPFYACVSIIFAIETFLIFQVLFIERFIVPSASVAPASSASVASTALHKQRYFGLRCPLYNCLDVFVDKVQGMLVVLWVPVFPGGEIIL